MKFNFKFFIIQSKFSLTHRDPTSFFFFFAISYNLDKSVYFDKDLNQAFNHIWIEIKIDQYLKLYKGQVQASL